MRIQYLAVLNTLIELDSLEDIYKIIEIPSRYEEGYPDMKETLG